MWSYESTVGSGDSVYFLTQNLRRAAFSPLKKKTKNCFALFYRVGYTKEEDYVLYCTAQGTLLNAMCCFYSLNGIMLRLLILDLKQFHPDFQAMSSE